MMRCLKLCSRLQETETLMATLGALRCAALPATKCMYAISLDPFLCPRIGPVKSDIVFIVEACALLSSALCMLFRIRK